MRIVTLIGHYLPGFKAGGPIQSLANLVEHLGGEFEFTVITRDRDSRDRQPYPGIASAARQRVGKAEVIYLNPSDARLLNLARVIRGTNPDALYVNSFFSASFSIAPIILRRVGLIPDVPMILAPRGELSFGALSIKAMRKRVFLSGANALRLHRGVTWQASSPSEEADIRRRIRTTNGGANDAVIVAPDLLAPASACTRRPPERDKAPGHLRVVFISRLTQKKNLLAALQVLAKVRGRVDLSIYGPIADQRYWEKCLETIKRLPGDKTVRYFGCVDHSQVPAALAEHHLFFLPTLDENYGHVIIEALQAGCPILVSDRTPWRHLREARVGWDLPLEHPARFQAALEECIAMDAATFAAWSERAALFAFHRATDRTIVDANRALFRGAARPRTVNSTTTLCCERQDPSS